ncbi:MAG: type II secretion system F family protein [Verrucomicrobiota bacterium]
MISSSAPALGRGTRPAPKKVSFMENQRLAKQKAYERQAKRKKIKMGELAVFTQQLAAMLEAGLPLVSALEALQEQTENPVFRIIIRDVRLDVSSGTAFSEACAKYPNAFPNLFVSMAEAGEASGGMADILERAAEYFENSVKLIKKVKSALTYPVAIIGLAVILVNVILIVVIPKFAEFFTDFGQELPAPTQFLINFSNFLQGNILWIVVGGVILFTTVRKLAKTPKGRRVKDQIISKLPIMGVLTQKINLSRFCRTYAILMNAGVPILRTLEITSRASGNTFIEDACRDISRNISQGGQVSDVLTTDPYFPPMVRHMARAGEQTGNVDGMLKKVSDFYDVEVENLVSALTSLLEPMLIVFLGVVIGGIVMAMFLPIFKLAGVAGEGF